MREFDHVMDPSMRAYLEAEPQNIPAFAHHFAVTITGQHHHEDVRNTEIPGCALDLRNDAYWAAQESVDDEDYLRAHLALRRFWGG